MRVIDLLNKIANGEDVPKKIKFEYLEYELLPERDNYYCSEHMRWFTNEINALGVLNDEVEVIGEKEETKTTARESIEALGYACGEIQKCFTNGWKKSLKNKFLNEEDKKIEKLENEKQFYSYRKYADIKNDIDKILYIIKGLNLTEEKIDNLNNKINEIIDKINGGKND